MAEKILILAKSGSGKSTSIRTMDPKTTMVIQPKKKRLPFPHKDWKRWDKDKAEGSIFQINTFDGIKAVLTKMEEVGKKTIIIDDFVYVLADRVMADVDTKGFEKWTELAVDFNNLMTHIDNMHEDIRVYIMTHTDEDDIGRIKMKTAGKLIDNLLTPEGMFTIVLGMAKTDSGSFFITNGSSMTPYKSPMDMWKDKQIPNDLKAVDDRIVEFYDIKD
ncbi:MAG: AAA family ATPase [Clostridiales bacterium]|nr:AAA family ATPase [Clostridiales bacterium]